MTKVNIVQGKRDFSRLIQLSNESDGEIIVTRRGIPVAVLISYDHYQRLKRLEGYRRILQTRKRFTAAGIRANEVYKESRRLLEDRP